MKKQTLGVGFGGYEATIGLEVHAELKTKTKMFCNSKNDPDEKAPNTNVCPICMGHPGTLPVINKEAVKHVLKVGVALGGKLADFSEFDRKNYFYPDIPKGYQISQYKFPLVEGGSLNNVAITRVHLEEDTGVSLHEEGDYSLLDFNRAGVPLMELVTEPVIHSAKEAVSFAKEFQLLLRYLGVSDANMEKGEMRIEANISVAKATKDGTLGTKVEVKNLNSFRTLERAIVYEVQRHIEVLEAGESVAQETRGWDDAKQKTFSQRKKEESHDYRYFPEPDLPKLLISKIPEFSKEVLAGEMPELPWQRRERFLKSHGIKGEDVETLINNFGLCAFFENTTSHLKNKEEIQLAINYITSDLVGSLRKLGRDFSDATIKFSAEEFAELIRLAYERKVSSRGVKDILTEMLESGGKPADIAKRKKLFQISDLSEIKKIAEEIIGAHAQVVSDYKAGKISALQFLVGQGIRASKGSADPELLRQVLKEILG